MPEDERWTGGVNYLHNLLTAIASVETPRLEPFLIAGDQLPEELVSRFDGLANVVRTPILNRHSAYRFTRRALARLTGRDPMFQRLLRKYRVDVASHCNIAQSGLACRTINWIPDFQHLHLPELFPSKEIARRERKYRQWLRDSDLMVFSSKNAMNDALRMAPEAKFKSRVLHFVSQANPRIYEMHDCHEIRARYRLPERFFYLPNQFWSHKNHRLVIEAVGRLRSEGCDVHVVCTGMTADLKESGHVESLMARIDELGIRSLFHVLGMIDYDDVLALFRHSIAVINPSRFEGWSSTVEEAKSVGKTVLLSNLAVHREQDPPGGRYFDPDDVSELATLLLDEWRQRPAGPDEFLERQARTALPERTRRFGTCYTKMVLSLMEGAV